MRGLPFRTASRPLPARCGHGGGHVSRFRSLSREDFAGYCCFRLPARSHPWASTHRDVTFNLTTPSWTSATADGGRYSLDDRKPRDTVSRISPELTTCLLYTSDAADDLLCV